MKIAVVGSGIAGLASAWLLSRSGQHQVALFEQNDYLGGHSNTVMAEAEGMTYPVDTGFLVFNDRTYPNLIRLFETFEVPWAWSDMSFSVKLCDEAGRSRLEWAGTNLASVFAQPVNLVRPAFLGMLRDVLRFNRQTTALVVSGEVVEGSLGSFLDRHGYGQPFRDWYLRPMAGCIWSTPTQRIDEFPLANFLIFCHNHGLLTVNDRPLWKTVVGGSREYVRRIAAELNDVRLNRKVLGVARAAAEVQLRLADGVERFDQLVLACHSDQALSLLSDADASEAAVLGAIPYQSNVAVLHTDARLLPNRKKAWAAWNFHGSPTASEARPVSLSYLINKLQPLPYKNTPVIVTLNPVSEPDPSTVQGRFAYEHPAYLEGSDVAQRKLASIQGLRRTWYCGAWTGHGFHEDGLKSALAVCERLGSPAPWTT